MTVETDSVYQRGKLHFLLFCCSLVSIPQPKLQEKRIKHNVLLFAYFSYGKIVPLVRFHDLIWMDCLVSNAHSI
jgi:hypothetical protein